MLRQIIRSPEKLRVRDKDGYPPIHRECDKACRSAVLAKCIELYPKSLGEAEGWGHLPLHRLLLNEVSAIEDALMMMEKYPAALKQ
jgi:hypothetical protein